MRSAEEAATPAPGHETRQPGSGDALGADTPRYGIPVGDLAEQATAIFPSPRDPRSIGPAEPGGPMTLTLSPGAAAGVSYLFLWISGVLVYFSERRNAYVRFHALQSILFGAAATVVGVIGVVLATLLMDLGSAWHASVLSRFGLICAVLIPFTLVLIWWVLVVAAWHGHELHLPILGRYAKQYAAPMGQPPASFHA